MSQLQVGKSARVVAGELAGTVGVVLAIKTEKTTKKEGKETVEVEKTVVTVEVNGVFSGVPVNEVKDFAAEELEAI